MIKDALKTEILREKIDWLAYTQKNSVDWQFPDYIEDKWKPINPLRNYTNGEENKQGIKRFWNTIRSDQGRMVISGGLSLDLLQDNAQEFVSFAGQMDNKITRVDYCLDIMEGSFSPQTCVSHLRKRDVVTHARQIPRIQDDWRGGFSQYVGTKSSETYTRIYDKAAEQGITGKWSRIETVYQGDRAEASLQAYLLHKSCRKLILSHVNFPKWKAWQRVMQGVGEKLHVPPRISNTRNWLLNQVASSIAKELLLDDDQQFLFDMIERVRFEYKRLSKDEQELMW